jgi:thiol-disulfide isomerase/thioredoxin
LEEIAMLEPFGRTISRHVPLFYALLCTALAGISGCGPEGATNPESEQGVGKSLSYVKLLPLTGELNPIGLEDLKGHVTLLNIWGWWCGPCRQELPHIAELRQRFADQPAFRLAAISYLSEDQESDVQSLRGKTSDLLKQLKLDLPTYYDPDWKTLDEIKAVANFQGFPTTLLLDRHGVIRAIWSGYWPGAESEMTRYIRVVLAEEGRK